MPNKRRFFAALLTALSLLSAWALAEIDLKPYEIESDRFTPVEILAPDMYLVLQDGSLNGVKQPTALVLLDHGQKVFEQRLPEEPSDGPHTFYSLFVADEKRYGLRIFDTSTYVARFQLLENGTLTQGFSIEGYPHFEPLPDCLCRLHRQDGMCFVERFDWNGILLSSTPFPKLNLRPIRASRCWMTKASPISRGYQRFARSVQVISSARLPRRQAAFLCPHFPAE